MNYIKIKEVLKRNISLIFAGLVSVALLITLSVVVANEDNTVSSSLTQQNSSVNNSSNTNSLSNQLELVNLEVFKLPTITTYTPVDSISTSGGELRVVFSDYSVRYVSMNDNMIDTTRLNTSTIGTSRVTLAYTFNQDTLYTSYNINIVPFTVNPTKLSIDIASSDVLLDQVVNLNYIIEPSNATYSNVEWTSSNPLIATVDNNGLVTPKNVGEVFITASSNELSASAKLNIIDNTPLSLEVDPALLPVISNVDIVFTNTAFAQTTEDLSLDFFSNKPGNYYYIIQGRTDDFPTINQLLSSNRNGQIQEGLINRVNSIRGFDYSNDMKLYMIVRSTDGFISQVLERDLSPTYLITHGWIPIEYNFEFVKIRSNTDRMIITAGLFNFNTDYSVTSGSDLNALRRNYFLTRDIYLGGYNQNQGWDPIGNSAEPFAGKFNALNYKIVDLTINRGASEQGLFGNINGAELRNIVFTDVAITIPVNTNDPATLMSIGTLAGYSNNSIIDNVRVNYGETTPSVRINVIGIPTANGVNLPLAVGGIVGFSTNTNISNVVFNGNVVGFHDVGGITGHFRTVPGDTVRKISRATVTGNITAVISAGGIVGTIYIGIIEISSYNGALSLNVGGGTQATLTGTGIDFGGIAARVNFATITNSYAIASINNVRRGVGGFAGFIAYTTISNSYVYLNINNINPIDTNEIAGTIFDLTTTGVYFNVEINGALSPNSTSDANMKLQSTYVGWDTNIWRFIANSLPWHI